MRVINLVVKFLAQAQSDSIVVRNGEIKIFGLDDATSALLQTEFEELLPCSPTASSSSEVNSTVLRSSYGYDDIEVEEALAKVTSYLNALDQQEFTVVSAFKDEFPTPDSVESKGHYKVYIWTMQK